MAGLVSSTMPLAEWRGRWTTFKSLHDTMPSGEGRGGWSEFIEAVAPAAGPRVVEDKARGGFFLPCALREAPLVGRTLERARAKGMPEVGRQRSSRHVAEAWAVVADLDGVRGRVFRQVVMELAAAGVAFVAYSTWSHGLKPGVRARLIVPVDRALGREAYAQAVAGLETMLAACGAQIDPCGRALHQAQGTWATGPGRKNRAFRLAVEGGVMRADVLLAAAPRPSKRVKTRATGATCPLDVERVREALVWLDPNGYDGWVRVGLWLKAAMGEAGLPVWTEWSLRADEDVRADEEACGARWETFRPDIPPEAGVGALFAAARDAAWRAVEQGVRGKQGVEALRYLARWHRGWLSRRVGDGSTGRAAGPAGRR